MARGRFPVSEALVGPWDALLSWLKGQDSPLIQGMTRGVQGAKQQAINLGILLDSLQSALSELSERVTSLEDAPSPSPVTAGTLQPFAETPTGTQDGSNATFTLSVEPVLLLLMLNGQLLQPGGVDYSLVANVIVYESGKVPATADSHYAFGLYSAS